MRHGLFETAVFPLDILGKPIEAEYNRKFVRIQGLDNFFFDQTAVGRDGILSCFIKVVLFFVEEGYCLFYLIEAE